MRQKFLDTKKNEINFTSRNGFKPNFKHYYIILLFSTICYQLFKCQPITDVTDPSSFMNLSDKLRSAIMSFQS